MMFDLLIYVTRFSREKIKKTTALVFFFRGKQKSLIKKSRGTNAVEAIPQQAVVSSPFRDSRFFHRDYVRP